MERILAIVVLIVFVWLAIPHIVRGEWIAPTAMAPGSWAATANYPGGDGSITYTQSQLAEADASTPAGYGWFRFDFWNKPPLTGRSASKQDLQFQSPRNEFKR